MQQENRPDKPGINDPDFIAERNKSTLTRRCPNCRQQIEGTIDVCPECKHYLGEGKAPQYQPISSKTARKIRWLLGGIIIVVFAVLAATGVIKLDCMSQ